MKKEIIDFYPQFYDWPDRWKGVEADREYGKELLKYFEPYVAKLCNSTFTARTKKKHLGNLWLAGGELVRMVSHEEDYGFDPLQLILENFGTDGGPYCRHLKTEEELNSYDSSCRKFYKDIKQNMGEPDGTGQPM